MVEFQPQKNQDIKCFKCLGSGHIPSQCPNKRVMVMQDSGKVMSESDGGEMLELIDANDDDDVEYPAKGESLAFRHTLSTQLSFDGMELQRENILHSRYIVNDKGCNMIIDSGSCTNIASTTLIKKLGLPLLTHPSLYRLQ